MEAKTRRMLIVLIPISQIKQFPHRLQYKSKNLLLILVFSLEQNGLQLSEFVPNFQVTGN